METMEKKRYANFVQHPRTVDDLMALHDAADEQPFEIVKTIRLQAIDFENFLTDMTVDRQYIEDAAYLCEDGKIKKCLFVCGRDPKRGILVIPEAKCYVGWAAYIQKRN